MSEEASRDDDLKWLWALFRSVNVELAKALCPRDFNWALLDPDSGKTVLQVLVQPLITSHANNIQGVLEMAEWMMQQGADPTLMGGEQPDSDGEDDNSDIFWKDDHEKDEDLHVSVYYAERSSISTVVDLIELMKEQTSLESDKIDWSSDIENMQQFLAVFGKAGPQTKGSKVAVSSSVVDLWELMCEDSASHDVTVQTSDGPVTAHSTVLKKVSPVLAAMLTTSMSEGQRQAIEVKDTSAESVKLLFSLMYTGATTMEFGSKAALAALDLAHRWQASNAVQMLENILAEKISDKNFAVFAEAAQLKGLPSLTKACRSFGATSEKVQDALKTQTLPRPALELMGALLETSRPSKKRRVW